VPALAGLFVRVDQHGGLDEQLVDFASSDFLLDLALFLFVHLCGKVGSIVRAAVDAAWFAFDPNGSVVVALRAFCDESHELLDVHWCGYVHFFVPFSVKREAGEPGSRGDGEPGR
jgi:hypothetical protein